MRIYLLNYHEVDRSLFDSVEIEIDFEISFCYFRSTIALIDNRALCTEPQERIDILNFANNYKFEEEKLLKSDLAHSDSDAILLLPIW